MLEVGTMLKCKDTGDIAIIYNIWDGNDDGSPVSDFQLDNLSYDLFYPASAEYVKGWYHDGLIEEFEVIV